MDFGKFLSVMSLVALFFAFRLAKKSDKKQNRTMFIWPLSIATGLVAMCFYFVTTFPVFLILALLLKALTILVEPIRSNIILDKTEKKPIDWISREVFLNIGRMFLVGVVALMLFFKLDKEIFIFLGLVHILFPFVVYYKKVYATSN